MLGFRKLKNNEYSRILNRTVKYGCCGGDIQIYKTIDDVEYFGEVSPMIDETTNIFIHTFCLCAERWVWTPHGNGTMMYTNGDIFKGYFTYGKRRYNGIVTRPDGYMFKGEYHNDKRDGIGTIYQTGILVAEYKYANDIPVYCNQLIKRKPHTYTIYTGEIDIDGIPSGQGSETIYRTEDDSTIETYAGKFENGHRHGIGYTNMRRSSYICGSVTELVKDDRIDKKLSDSDLSEVSEL